MNICNNLFYYQSGVKMLPRSTKKNDRQFGKSDPRYKELQLLDR